METLLPGTNATTTIKSNANTLPPLLPPEVPGDVCNADWPVDTYQRFLWVIDYLISRVCALAVFKNGPFDMGGGGGGRLFQQQAGSYSHFHRVQGYWG